MDTRRWLKNSDGEIRALLLIKLVEQKTAEIPPPLCLDERAEDDNYRPGPGEPGYESLDIDPVYESLRESTKTEDWVGTLDGFAELWRLNHAASVVERDGGRVVSISPSTSAAAPAVTDEQPQTILPRGRLPVAITRSGFYATRPDHVATWGLDMERYCDFIGEAAKKMAFTRRVRYIKAVEALQEAQKT